MDEKYVQELVSEQVPGESTTEERIDLFVRMANKYIGYPHTEENLLYRLEDLGFFDMPASTKYHGAYTGGLFDHSVQVTRELIKLTQKLELHWERPMSPFIVGMLHDICKCDSYVFNVNEGKWEYRKDILIPGHGDKSVIMAQDILSLTPEEIHCIRWHMGAYETDTKMWDYYGRAVEKYPNVLWTHTADMVASKIVGV